MSHIHDAPKAEAAMPPRIAPSRLRHTAARLVGREEALSRLDGVWADARINVVVIQAWGGVGKTSLVAEWMARLSAEEWRGARRVFDWTFYSQGTRADGDADKVVSADLFFADALAFFGDPDPQAGSPWDRGARLAGLVAKERGLLVLDGVEPLQHPPGPLAGQISDPALLTLLKVLARQNAGLCIVTTRETPVDLGPMAHYRDKSQAGLKQPTQRRQCWNGQARERDKQRMAAKSLTMKKKKEKKKVKDAKKSRKRNR